MLAWVRRSSVTRKVALLLCLGAGAVACFGQKRVTVEELAQRLAATHGRSDGREAQKLENLQLTQRLSGERLETLEAGLPGPKSRGALLAVADLAEVLELPPEEVPSDPPPPAQQQQQIVARAIEASENPAARLFPDFDVTTDTTHFRNLKYFMADTADPECRECASASAMAMEGANRIPIVVPVPLATSHGTAVVTDREDSVFLTQRSRAWAPADSIDAGADSWEGLYALLGDVLHDMRAAQPDWVGWEPGPTGKLAVFGFTVDQDHSHFHIRTVINPSLRRGFDGDPGYRAEIALDPATGAVHRLVLRALLKPHEHVSRADVVMEFDPIQINGKSFLFPARTVTIGVTQSLVGFNSFSLRESAYEASEDIRPLIHLVDVEFTDYRAGQSKPPALINSAFLAKAIRTTGEHVTVEQLEEVVSDLGRASDHDAAERLGQLELTQRLTAELYARMRAWLPGSASANALLALYDKSQFEDLPPAGRDPAPAPDAATQGKIIVSAVEFVARVTHQMTDLFATRELTRFEDLQVVRGSPDPVLAEVKPLVLVGQATGTVHFRAGREVVEAALKRARAKLSAPGMDTWGTFGPILEIVMADVLHARIGWSHWEEGPSGRLAVFRYAVPESKSQYEVRLCCYLGTDGLPSSFSAKPGYHGELFIDPKSGEILRLVLKVDFGAGDAKTWEPGPSPLLRSDVLVDYGAFEIGGEQYICPERSISVMTTWTLGPNGPLKTAMTQAEGKKAVKKALEEMEFSRVNAINEAAFSDYHVFRSNSRILTGPVQEAPKKPKK